MGGWRWTVVGLALACAPTVVIAANGPPAPGPQPTIPRSELWRPLYPDRPNDPNSPVATGDPDVGVSEENALGRGYHWAYARTDPTSGMPLQLPEGDPRIAEIDEYRVQCIKLISGYLDENGVPERIPVSKFKNLQDQSAEAVLACLNNLHLKHERWLKGVGAIVCEVNTNHCWGPRDIWAKFGPQGATAGQVTVRR